MAAVTLAQVFPAEARTKRPRLALVCLFVVLLIGCSQKEAVNEQNRFFQRGKDHVESGEAKKAMAAFEECLRRSPASFKAHLELGMLYEDHSKNFAKAIVHYQSFLAASDDPDRKAAVSQWLNRAERSYLDELRLIYEGPQSATRRLVRLPPTHSAGTESIANGLPPAAHQPPILVNESPTPIQATGPAPREVEAPEPALLPEADEEAFRWYTVRSGDSLSRIARRELGSSTKWGDIYTMNRDVLPNETKLRVGQRLRIPVSEP